MKMTIVVSPIPNVYDKSRVKSWVICDFRPQADMDERNTRLGTMSYEEAHQRHMQYLAELRAQGLTVEKQQCGRVGCRDCEDDHQHSWKYRDQGGETRAVCLFSCR